MAKGSKKRVLRYDNDQSGCMWGLINIFDFRHGSPSQKLLTDKKRVADKKRGSKRISGAAYSEHNRPEDPCELCEEADAGEQCEATLTGKLSVKELMDDEMFGHQERGQISKFDEGPKQTVSGQQGHGRKNHWLSNKNSLDLSVVDNVSKKPVHRKHRSLSSLDVNRMMAELSSQVNVNDVNRLSCDHPHKDISVPPEDPSVTEKKLGEATKVFMSHFVAKKSTNDSTMKPSGELVEALQVLNSNKDMFLKLLKDPDSQLAKHIEKLEDHQGPVRSDSIVQGKGKHQSYFWRKFKGVDRNLSKRNEHAQDASTIVVLKPGLDSSQIPDIGTRAQGEGTSHFFFTDFTRRLRLAMRKEQPFSGNVDKTVGGENLGMASPSRDHFFIEKIPKSPKKRGDKAGRSFEATSTPEQRISEIYIEAKKHLAEIVGKSEVEGNLTRQVPKALGRILSYSDHSLSPICSPRKDKDHKIAVQLVQGKKTYHTGSAKDESGSSAEEIGDHLHVLKDEYNPLQSTDDEIQAEGDPEIRSPHDARLQNQISLYATLEPHCLSTCRNEPVEEMPKVSQEEQSMHFHSDVMVVNGPSSPSASSSFLSRTKDVEDSDATTDRSDRPSPVSVLDLIFKDDVSPLSVKHFSVSESFQPRKIKFEDQISSAPCPRNWEDEKNAVFAFVEVVVRSSGLTRDQLLERFLFSEHLLDPSPSVFDQVDALQDRLCHDSTLLFDLLDEVLADVCGRDFEGIPSLYTPYMELMLKRKDVINEIWDGVHSHLQSEYRKPTLDEAIAEEFSRSWTWMDPRLDSESTGLEMEECIFKELVEDAIMSLISWNDEQEVSVLLSNQEM